MAKKVLLPGNVYKVINENKIRYFQYFYTDPN